MTMTATTDYRPMRKAGALRNGAERGKGSIYHAVAPSSSGWGKALCGETPAIMWCEGGAAAVVTCPRCIRKMHRGERDSVANGSEG